MPLCSSLFFRRIESDIVLLLIYADDIIVTGNSTTLIREFIYDLSSAFHMKYPSDLHYFLGI